ncbi:hypothetical protein M1N79_04960 [Dehalococcoidia bacterium]|nr:hypothetical protein [Dehalococcoidia bacterium]
MRKSFIVEIDEAAHKELEVIGQERNSKLENEIAEAVKAHIEWRKAYANDPFFQIGKAGRSGLGDLAEAHDRYLYNYEGSK